jgi:hypothetical protein
MGMQRAHRASLRCGATITCGIATFLAAVFATTVSAAAFELITVSEAALPPGPTPSFEVRGSPARLPSVTVVSPHLGGGAVYSPLELKLDFRAFGGAAVDPDSVVITYVKNPNIDISPRIRPFITAQGIDIAQADVPPGLHKFWIELKDTDGRIGGREFDIQVVK